jgi:hypothetical protein
MSANFTDYKHYIPEDNILQVHIYWTFLQASTLLSLGDDKTKSRKTRSKFCKILMSLMTYIIKVYKHGKLDVIFHTDNHKVDVRFVMKRRLWKSLFLSTLVFPYQCIIPRVLHTPSIRNRCNRSIWGYRILRFSPTPLLLSPQWHTRSFSCPWKSILQAIYFDFIHCPGPTYEKQCFWNGFYFCL